MNPVEQGLARFIEGAPLIVLVLGGIGWVVWTAWRSERQEWLNELRAERAARAEAHTAMLSVADRSAVAIHAVREAVTELRHAIRQVNGGRGD
jgi:hypothetical protein